MQLCVSGICSTRLSFCNTKHFVSNSLFSYRDEQVAAVSADAIKTLASYREGMYVPDEILWSMIFLLFS